MEMTVLVELVWPVIARYGSRRTVMVPNGFGMLYYSSICLTRMSFLGVSSFHVMRNHNVMKAEVKVCPTE